MEKNQFYYFFLLLEIDDFTKNKKGFFLTQQIKRVSSCFVLLFGFYGVYATSFSLLYLIFTMLTSLPTNNCHSLIFLPQVFSINNASIYFF